MFGQRSPSAAFSVCLVPGPYAASSGVFSMKRNVDLIRSIVLAVRNDDMSVLEEFAADEVAYHKWLIVNAGLATGTEIRHQTSAAIAALTWEGQNFSDAAGSFFA